MVCKVTLQIENVIYGLANDYGFDIDIKDKEETDTDCDYHVRRIIYFNKSQDYNLARIIDFEGLIAKAAYSLNWEYYQYGFCFKAVSEQGKKMAC